MNDTHTLTLPLEGEGREGKGRFRGEKGRMVG
jgi:hypothetical protein